MQSFYPLLLASQSPRRVQLLQEANIQFEQRSPPFSDPDQPPTHLTGSDAERYATQLAQDKAASLIDTLDSSATVLAADTICVDDQGTLIGKPVDQADAKQMLHRFVAGPHRVITGVCLQTVINGEPAEATAFADTATVSFGPITEAQIASYLATDDWRDKAGGYNLFDRQAAGWPIEITGDPTTVVGLPMQRLLPQLTASLHSNP